METIMERFQVLLKLVIEKKLNTDSLNLITLLGLIIIDCLCRCKAGNLCYSSNLNCPNFVQLFMVRVQCSENCLKPFLSRKKVFKKQLLIKKCIITNDVVSFVIIFSKNVSHFVTIFSIYVFTGIL